MDRKEKLQQELNTQLDELDKTERLMRVVILVLEKMRTQKLTRRVVTALKKELPEAAIYLDGRSMSFWGGTTGLTYNTARYIRGKTIDEMIEYAKHYLPELDKNAAEYRHVFESELAHLDEILSDYEAIENQIAAFNQKYGRLEYNEWSLSHVVRDVLSLIK